jgi:ABC-type tungstate transport system substrate-binding protein
MRFFTLILFFTFTLVALSAYLLLSLNSEIVLIDLLFTEIQLSLGTALLSFFIIGFLVTLVLELINSFRRNKIKE